jgi:hypothetical protein
MVIATNRFAMTAYERNSEQLTLARNELALVLLDQGEVRV